MCAEIQVFQGFLASAIEALAYVLFVPALLIYSAAAAYMFVGA